MKTSTLTIVSALGILGAVFLLHPFSSLLGQGALTPPGPPAPTMKSLDQIEPHTPISSLPLTISTSGSYYLTGNLTATADGDSISVQADNVTIDLNGFTLAGGNTGSRIGISVPFARKNLCVRNGTLTGWTTRAINASVMSGGLYENLHLVANVTSNPALEVLAAGGKATVRACIANGNVGGAISAGDSATVSGCSVTNNTGNSISTDVNSFVSDCVVTNTVGFAGIATSSASKVANCTANNNSSRGISASARSMVVNCAASLNQTGIQVGAESTVAHCNVTSNSGTGIQADDSATLTDCAATTNFINVIAGNGCTISRCTVAHSTQSGMIISGRNQITGCTFEGNNTSSTSGKPGLQIQGAGNRIDGNHLASNNYAGLTATGVSGNIIIRNTFYGAQSIIDPGNITGPGVVMSSGGTIASTSPWANIYY